MNKLAQILRRMQRFPEQLRPHAAKAMLVTSYRTTFGTPDGEVALNDILRRCGLLAGELKADAREDLVALGRRQIALEIIELLGWSEAEVIMLAERQTSMRMQQLWDDTEEAAA